MKIAIDLDGVLADIVPHLISFYNKELRKNISYAEISEAYRFGAAWGMNVGEEIALARNFFESDIFWEVQPVEGSQRGVDIISKNNDILILTSRYGRLKERSLDWLSTHFPNKFSKDNSYFTGEWYTENEKPAINKARMCMGLNVDLIVEDDLTYATRCVAIGTKALLLDYPLNRSDKDPRGVTRVASWADIPREVERIKNEM